MTVDQITEKIDELEKRKAAKTESKYGGDSEFAEMLIAIYEVSRQLARQTQLYGELTNHMRQSTK